MEYITTELVLVLGSIVLLIANIYVQREGDVRLKGNMERVNTVFHETVKLFNKLDKAETEAENNKQPIEVLNLPVRAENALINNNVKYVEDLRNIDIYDLELMRGLGKVAVEHIVRALKNVK